MRIEKLLALWTVIFLGGCMVPPELADAKRGHFTLVSSRSLPGFEVAGLQPRVSARECFITTRLAIEHAVEEAIAQVPGANVLVLAEIKDDGPCVTVEGWPIKKELSGGP